MQFVKPVVESICQVSVILPVLLLTRSSISRNNGRYLIALILLFGAIYGISLDHSWMPDFNSQRFVMTTALGFAPGLIRERSQSLLTGIVLHNPWNLVGYWGQ